MKAVGTACVAILLLAGCTSAEDAQMKQQNGVGAFGAGPLNFAHLKEESYAPGETNLGTSYIHPDVAHRTLEDDARQVEQIVQEHGFRSGPAFVNGSHIYVKAHPNEHWSKDETERHQADLEKALRAEIPRYQVQLR